MPMGNHVALTPLEDMSGGRGQAGGGPPQNCLKVFIQRDYSQGTMVRFQNRFPTELADRFAAQPNLTTTYMTAADMTYLVVKFDDGTVSEVPSNWLESTDDKTLCWWPIHSKKIGSLITKRAEPDKITWELLNVKIEKRCQTLEKARKAAYDEHYKTTDDEDLGKGCRQSKKRVVSSSDDEDENYKQPNLSRIRPSQKTRSILSDLPVAPNDAVTSPVSTNSLKIAVSTGTVFVKPHEDIGYSDCTSNESLELSDEHVGKRIDRSGKQSGSCAKFPEQASLKATKLVNEGSNSVDSQNRTLQDNQRVIIRMVASMEIQLRDILRKLDRGNQPEASGDTNLVKSELPLKSIVEIENFERGLSEKPEMAKQFATFVRKIGGRSAREDIQRICRQVFTNACAQLCSWKGRKQNFCIEDLRLTKTIKEAIMEGHPTTKEIEFEETVAEWFRFAKQRGNREAEHQKKKTREK